MSVKLMWGTIDADGNVAFMARASNVKGQKNKEFGKLLRYLMRNGHVSPFEMANACIEINTTRDIARQILRHRSFSFQEFSGRYADMTDLGEMVERECRLQDTKNRQSSLLCDDDIMVHDFLGIQREIWDSAVFAYKSALEQGVAKEQARALLPEGLTPTRLYMNGNLRSWIFYLKQRLDKTTQKEHRIIAEQVLEVLREVAPVTVNAFFGEKA